jgi:hypothetical protein
VNYGSSTDASDRSTSGQASATEPADAATTDATDVELHLPTRPASRWHRAGLGRRGARVLDGVMVVLVALLAVGWTWTLLTERTASAAELRPHAVTRATRTIAAALTRTDAPSTAFLVDAALNAMAGARGRSGALHVQIQAPGEALVLDSLPHGAEIVYAGNGEERLPTPPRAGVWRAAIAVGQIMKPVSDFSFITLRPFADKQRGRIGSYVIGNWPAEAGRRVPGPTGRTAPQARGRTAPRAIARRRV